MKKETSKTNKSVDPRKKLSPEVREALDAYNADMKAHIETLQKKSDEDIKQYIGSVSEEHQARTSAVAEQYSGLNEKIDTLGKEVKAKLDVHTEMIGTLMETTEEIKEELKTKADKTEVVHLSRRVAVLEHAS
jgi:predicted urease superfamily metal-dependent hydrolase